MSQTYLLPTAVNTRTGQTLKQQDLTGNRFTAAQRKFCQEIADQLAGKMTARTGDLWQGRVIEYTPTQRRSSI